MDDSPKNWERAVGYAAAEALKVWREKHDGAPPTPEPPMVFLTEWIANKLATQWFFKFPPGSMWDNHE